MAPTHPDARHANTALESALQRIYGLHRKEIDFRLDAGPYRDLLIKLGNPQDHLPPVIHVAGTNGKGSTIAMLRALAEAKNLRVHAYTSPHLFRFNERLRVSGALISDATLLAAIDHINAVNKDVPVTFFEFTSALMFHLFATHPADIALIETGMGGRLDCTNVVVKPSVTVITSISFDHMDFLGDTIEKIATEKAGIMKSDVPCVIAPQRYDAVWPVFEKKAAELGVTLHRAAVTNDTPTPNLHGAHQRDNAATAMKAFDILYPDTPRPTHLTIDWPGRFQILRTTPPLIYDGAHNEDSARVLAATMKEKYPHQPVSIVLAMQANKDVLIFIYAFKDVDVQWHCVSLDGGRAPQTASALATQLQRHNITPTGIHDTMEQALSNTPPDRITLITGSLYAAQLIPGALWPKT